MTNGETVYVVDDDPAVCDALCKLLEAAGYRAKAYASGSQFLAELRDDDQVACLVVDLHMPEMGGFEVKERLEQRKRSVPCVFLTGYADVPTAVEAMRRGAWTFLEKPCKPEQLLAAVGAAVSERKKARAERAQWQALLDRLAQLTEEEQLVLDGLVNGLNNAQIAARLDLGLRTVQLRKKSLMTKLEVSTRAELISIVLAARRASG